MSWSGVSFNVKNRTAASNPLFQLQLGGPLVDIQWKSFNVHILCGNLKLKKSPERYMGSLNLDTTCYEHTLWSIYLWSRFVFEFLESKIWTISCWTTTSSFNISVKWNKNHVNFFFWGFWILRNSCKFYFRLPNLILRTIKNSHSWTTDKFVYIKSRYSLTIRDRRKVVL